MRKFIGFGVLGAIMLVAVLAFGSWFQSTAASANKCSATKAELGLCK